MRVRIKIFQIKKNGFVGRITNDRNSEEAAASLGHEECHRGAKNLLPSTNLANVEYCHSFGSPAVNCGRW